MSAAREHALTGQVRCKWHHSGAAGRYPSQKTPGQTLPQAGWRSATAGGHLCRPYGRVLHQALGARGSSRPAMVRLQARWRRASKAGLRCLRLLAIAAGLPLVNRPRPASVSRQHCLAARARALRVRPRPVLGGQYAGRPHWLSIGGRPLPPGCSAAVSQDSAAGAGCLFRCREETMGMAIWRQPCAGSPLDTERSTQEHLRNWVA